jgi:copper chaperone CopZ
LKDTDGIKASLVNLEQDRATVVYEPEVVSINEIKQRITDVGYQVGDVKEVQP